jgi:dsDNA-binding SOS-regulon protein
MWHKNNVQVVAGVDFINHEKMVNDSIEVLEVMDAEMAMSEADVEEMHMVEDMQDIAEASMSMLETASVVDYVDEVNSFGAETDTVMEVPDEIELDREIVEMADAVVDQVPVVVEEGQVEQLVMFFPCPLLKRSHVMRKNREKTKSIVQKKKADNKRLLEENEKREKRRQERQLRLFRKSLVPKARPMPLRAHYGIVVIH